MLNWRADRILDGLRLGRDRHIDLSSRRDRRTIRDEITLAGYRDGDAIATALAPPFGDQPPLFHQQGEASLQHPRRQRVGQSLANGPDLHSVRMMARHNPEDSVELFFWNPLWHVADYMSRNIFKRHKTAYLT